MSNTSIIQAKDVIEAYEKHGDKFLDIDIYNMRENGAKTVKYVKLLMTKADGIVITPIIKFFNQTTAGKIKEPAERDYAQLKIAIRRDNVENPDDLFGKAMELICNTFTKRVKELKSSGLISDDIDDEDNADNVVIVPSCRPQTPLQKRALNKEGVLTDFDNPMFWFGLNNKRYTQEEEEKLPVLDFVYKKDGKKFVVKDFDLNIYDLENLNSSNRPNLAKVDNKLLDNTNIQKFLTLKSLVSGTVYMQVVISKSFNLNTKVSSSLYVKSNKNVSDGSSVFNDDEFEMMMGGTAPASNVQENTNNQQKKEVTKNESKEEDDEDDSYDTGSNLDKIANLTL